MKRTLIVAAIVLGFICTAFSAEKINIQIVYDCSGSMGGKTEGGSGKQKAEVAKTAMSGIVRMISQFVKASPNTEINIGIVSFRGGKNGVILPLQKFDSVKVNQAVENLPRPDGGTPLGVALKTAYEGLPKDGRSHIFVITDGEENGGLKMPEVIKDRKDVASLYFVAFDVNAEVFNGVKSLGAMVVQANSAAELNSRVQTIFSQNILLEKED